jgi:hypothetical protein
MTAGGGTITSTQAQSTSAVIGKTVIVRGAGAGGVDTYILQVVSVAGNVATMNGAAGTIVSGATAGIDVMTNDGIHPLTGGCIDIAPSINVAKLT